MWKKELNIEMSFSHKEVVFMEKMSMIYEALLELQAEKILDESLKKYHLRRIYDEIDFALEQGDQETFLALTNKLKSMKIC